MARRRGLAVLRGSPVLDAHQKVKVVLEQAVRVGLGYGLDILCVELEKVWVVALLAEERFAVVATVVDVVVLVWEQRG